MTRKVERHMFTGIIRAQGRLSAVRLRATGREIVVVGLEPAWRLSLGDSVAVDGVCLTVEALSADGREGSFYLSRETVERTTAGGWAAGRTVHLEPAVRAGDPLGGHVVSGHVDTTTTVVARSEIGEDTQVDFALPPDLVRAFVPKGSVAIDGVSLTVNDVGEHSFSVNLIPHTRGATHLGNLRVGDAVNVEADPVARHVAFLVERMSSVRAL